MIYEIKNLTIDIPYEEIEYFRKRQNDVPSNQEVVMYLMHGTEVFKETDPLKAILKGMHADIDDYSPIY